MHEVADRDYRIALHDTRHERVLIYSVASEVCYILSNVPRLYPHLNGIQAKCEEMADCGEYAGRCQLMQYAHSLGHKRHLEILGAAEYM